MPCSCIKEYGYNVRLSYRDCRHLVYTDMSNWQDAATYDIPDTYEVKVSVPSRNVENTFPVTTNRNNLISSNELFGTNEKLCLPDDIYCFSCFTCGNEHIINRAFLCNCHSRIDELVARAKTQEDYEQANMFRSMAESIDVNVRMGNIETARELLKVLKKKLKHLTCVNCGCENQKSW